MSGDFRIEVEAVERGEGGTGRVGLRLEKPRGLGTGALDKQLAELFAQELGSRVGLPVRRVPWGDGIRVQNDASIVVSGLDASGQVQLDSHAREVAEETTRELRPEGRIGSRLHEIVRRLGPFG